jgi:pimeloyl-ACP methyl ester carboxylesterase
MGHPHRRREGQLRRWGARRLILSVTGMMTAITVAPALSAETPNQIFAETRQLITKDAVDDVGLVPIGGIQQWVSVRGRHRDNPVLLWIHAGPGFTMSPVSYFYMRDWEEYFTVAQWDQRGAGKTYLANDPAQVRPTMSITRMVDDAEEVAAHLRKTYGKRRIILMAHSFGTIVGLRLAQRHPDWFYAYVGTGQFIDFQASEAAGFAATLADARAAKNGQAIEDLTRIAPFPDRAHPERNLQNLGVERKWLAAYGGYYWPAGEGHFVKIAQMSPDYSAQEFKTMMGEGQAFSDQALWGEIGAIDFTRSVRFGLPVIILQGRHDRATSAALVAAWFDRVRAPSKRIVWFADSAHMAHEEEPGKMLVSLVNLVRPLARD